MVCLAEDEDNPWFGGTYGPADLVPGEADDLAGKIQGAVPAIVCWQAAREKFGFGPVAGWDNPSGKPRRTNPASAATGRLGGRPKGGIESRTLRYTAAVSGTVCAWLRSQPGDKVERMARQEMEVAGELTQTGETK